MSGNRDFRGDGSPVTLTQWVTGYILLVLIAVLWVLALVFGQGEQP